MNVSSVTNTFNFLRGKPTTYVRRDSMTVVSSTSRHKVVILIFAATGQQLARNVFENWH